MAEQAYFRRRGWIAYHVALLGRIDAKRFPDLDQLTGERMRRRPPQAPEHMLHNLMLHAAAQNASLEGPIE